MGGKGPMYYAAFLGTIAVLLLVQYLVDRKRMKALGNCQFNAEIKPGFTDYLRHLFRVALCLIIAAYFIIETGDAFRVNILIFLILLGGLASKICYPVVSFMTLAQRSGVYENGVVTFGGILLFQNIKCCSVRLNQGNQRSMFIFVSKIPYLSRPVYFYVNSNKTKKTMGLINGRCVCFCK